MADGHLLFVWKTSGYELREQDGDVPAVVRRDDADREVLRRAAANRGLDGLTHDLVERRLGALAERLGGGDVDLDLDAVLEASILRQGVHRHRQAVVAQHDRLEVEREVT